MVLHASSVKLLSLSANDGQSLRLSFAFIAD